MSFRQRRLTRPIFDMARKAVPNLPPVDLGMTATAEAHWWDRQVFSGNPDWERLLAIGPSQLAPDEQAFLDGPAARLCALLHEPGPRLPGLDLPAAAWDFLRERKFLGMAIPREHGGLGFSHIALSEVARKLASANPPAELVLMLANAERVAQIVIRLGTVEQRRVWLPRLAEGREIPFAAPAPSARDLGFSESSVPAVVARREQDSIAVLGIRLSVHRPTQPLAPIATAALVRLELLDPEGHLGGDRELGPAMALVPLDEDGVEVQSGQGVSPASRRRRAVFVGLDRVIGGAGGLPRAQGGPPDMTRSGDLLAVSLAAGLSGLCARAAGAAAKLRSGPEAVPDAFHGEQHNLARLAATIYEADAARRLTAAILDGGEHPTLFSALLGETGMAGMRESVLAAKDVCPARPDSVLPLTVPGIGSALPSSRDDWAGDRSDAWATAVLAHPFIPREIRALIEPGPEHGLRAFDQALWAHAGQVLQTALRAFVRGWTGGLAAPAPRNAAFTGHWRQLSRFASAFSLLADLSLPIQGTDALRREMLGRRLGGMAVELYRLAAALRRFETEGRPEADRPILEYILQTGYGRLGLAFTAVMDNLPSRWAATVTRAVAFPLGVPHPVPTDELVAEVAAILMRSSSQRDRLTPDLYLGEGLSGHPLQELEIAFDLVNELEPIERKLRAANLRDAEEGVARGVIDGKELARLREARASRARLLVRDGFDAAAADPAA